MSKLQRWKHQVLYRNSHWQEWARTRAGPWFLARYPPCSLPWGWERQQRNCNFPVYVFFVLISISYCTQRYFIYAMAALITGVRKPSSALRERHYHPQVAAGPPYLRPERKSAWVVILLSSTDMRKYCVTFGTTLIFINLALAVPTWSMTWYIQPCMLLSFFLEI